MLKCVFPVAGLGTRFLPATKSIPKEMFPILDKPLLQYSIEEALTADITHHVIVINEHKLAIKNFFEPFPYLDDLLEHSNKKNLLENLNNIIRNCSFEYIQQKKMLGLGHAILQAKTKLSKDPFAVILPDDLCYNKNESVISQMKKVLEKNPDKSIIAIEEVDKTKVVSYGIVDAESIDGEDNVFNVRSMVEKPLESEAPSNLAIIGRYILQYDIFEVLERTLPDQRGEIQITDALNFLAKQGKVIAYKFEGNRIDCGNFEGYISANNFFLNL